jgi:hypothetical protein
MRFSTNAAAHELSLKHLALRSGLGRCLAKDSATRLLRKFAATAPNCDNVDGQNTLQGSRVWTRRAARPTTRQPGPGGGDWPRPDGGCVGSPLLAAL